MEKRKLLLVIAVIVTFILVYYVMSDVTHIKISPAYSNEVIIQVKDSNDVEKLLTSLDNTHVAGDRIKTPFINKLTVYKGFLPVKYIKFEMPEMFTEDDYGQVLMGWKVYQIDNSFYQIMSQIAIDYNISLDTL